MLRVVDEATEAIEVAWGFAPAFRPFVKELMAKAVTDVADDPGTAPGGSYEMRRAFLAGVASGFVYGYDVATRHSYSDFITYGDIPEAVRKCGFWDEMVAFAGCEGARDATLAVAASFVEQMAEIASLAGEAKPIMEYGFLGAARGFELGAMHEETGLLSAISCDYGFDEEDEAVDERMIGIVGDSLAEAEERLSHEMGIAFAEAPEALGEVRTEVVQWGFDFATRCLASMVYEGGLDCDPSLVVGRIRTWVHHMLAGIVDRMFHAEETPGLGDLLAGVDDAMGVTAGLDATAAPALSVMWSACRRDQLPDETFVAGIAYARWMAACFGTGTDGPVTLAPARIAGDEALGITDADEMRLPIAAVAYATGLRAADRLGLEATDGQMAERANLSYELPDDVAWRESWDVEEDDGLPAWRSVTYARALAEALSAGPADGGEAENADDAPYDARDGEERLPDGRREDEAQEMVVCDVYENPAPEFDIAAEHAAKGRRAEFRLV